MDISYFDTSLIVKLYIPEEGSEKVFKFVEKKGVPLLLNHFQETELRNAFALKAFRKEISASQLSKIQKIFNREIEMGRFIRQKVSWNEVWLYTQKLSKEYSASIGCRTMDILHVAIASQMGATSFFTNDSRQKKLADALNMKVTWD